MSIVGKKPHRAPSYRQHKPSGQAVVTLDGRDWYLGKFGTKASHAEYDRLVAEWLAGGRRLPVGAGTSSDLTVLELAAAYWRYCTAYYEGSGERTNIRDALRPLRELYGKLTVAEFGPMRLKVIRQKMVDAKLARSTVNQRVNRIRRAFKWGVENELVEPSVLHALQAVPGLKRGRSGVREPDPVTPVDDRHVNAVKPHVSRQVWGMIELQRLTGMRSGEIVIMRSRDIDTTGDLWLYTPSRHKTAYHGHARTVELGKRAQKIIKPFLKPDVDAYLFSPADADVEKRAAFHATRKTLLSCGNKPGSNRKRRPRKRPGDKYTPQSYGRAIMEACKTAKVPHWNPHRLRHNFASMVRKKYGMEVARILLGHRSPRVTELYAEADRTKARDIVRRIG